LQRCSSPIERLGVLRYFVLHGPPKVIPRLACRGDLSAYFASAASSFRQECRATLTHLHFLPKQQASAMQDIDRSPCRHGVRYPTGTIMNRLHWTAVLVVFLLGGGFAVAALIIVVVMVALRVAAQLFDDGPD
jgi:hypothetical protein